MNKINALFAHRGDRKLLSLYFCAGCPTLEGTADVILTLQRRGISMIEVGIPFDWTVLSSYHGSTPYLLSGGIGPDDGERLHAFHHPQMAGIDLNSRFEIRPAVKDIHLLKSFLHEQD